MRRAGKINSFTSIFIHQQQRSINIASDGGRVCRPLIIVEGGISKVQQKHIDELKDGYRNFDDFIKEGLIEFLDVNEENNAYIALKESEIQPTTSHVEIEPLTLLG